MENLTAIFFSSFVIAFSGALMPGPLLSFTISESGRLGWKVGPLYILGHAVLEVLLITALLLGMAPFLASDGAFIVIAFAGGSFLVWLAWGMIRSLPALSLSKGKPIESDTASELSQSGIRTGGRNRNLVLTGALMSIANPYWIIWWATIGLGYVISSQESGYAGLTAFFLGHISADFLWYAFVSFSIDKGRGIMSDGVYKTLIAACAAFLCAYSGYLLFSGFSRFV